MSSRIQLPVVGPEGAAQPGTAAPAPSPDATEGNGTWEPRVVAFACYWCSYAGADMAGTLRLHYPPNVHVVQLPCSGHVDALYLLKAFEGGADGVVVSGCHPGDCHYFHGNLLSRRRFALMRQLMHLLGLDSRRLHFAWVSASEGAKWAELMTDAVDQVRSAGPLGGWSGKPGASAPRPSLPARGEAPRGRPDPARDAAVTDHLRAKARELLEEGRVSQVVGYGKAPAGPMAPLLIRDPDGADALEWNDRCFSNLATYLPRHPHLHPAAGEGSSAKEGAEDTDTPANGPESSPDGGSPAPSPGRVAVVAKPCDAKAIVGLEQENRQVDRSDLVVLGVPCSGMWEDDALAAKCYACAGGTTSLADWRITPEGAVAAGEAPEEEEGAPLPTTEDPRRAELDALWEASSEARWAYWQDQFQHCLRCDACRAVCPLCYCDTCVTEKHRPQWISPAADAKGNTAWNFIRAYHLVGRCVGCDECARACPADIRLDLVNLAMAREVEERFGYRAGEDATVPPPLATYQPDDPEEFIR